MKRRQNIKAGILMTGLITLAAVCVAMLIAASEPVRSLELDLRDYRFRLRGPLNIDNSPILILALDDQSDDSVPGRWPWPRSYFARVIENLNRAGAAVIGIDVIFDQPDRHSAESDKRFEETLKAYRNVVLSGKLERRIGRFSTAALRPPLSRFLETGCHWGLVSTEVDKDGIFRRYLLTQSHLDSSYLSFALEVLKVYRAYAEHPPVSETLDRLIIGQDTIPKSDAYSMLINYAGPANSFPMIPFDNVLDDSTFELNFPYDLNTFDDRGDPELGIPPGLLHSGKLKDKIVLIGATMKELQDYFPTPFLETLGEEGSVKMLTAGVEIHANALQTILGRQFISELSPVMDIVLLVLLALLTGLLVRKLAIVWATLLTLMAALGFFAAAFWLFIGRGLFITITLPLTGLLFSFIGNYLYQFMLSQREKRMIQGAFAHYVPEKIVNEIINDPDMLTLGGEERLVTVLFSDIAGFTTVSERLTPSDLVALLNEYLTAMCEVILAHDGIIDKFEGDAIMAEFGVPITCPDHADQACLSALDMQRRLTALREKWKAEKKPELKMRVGINTGVAVVGNMGSRDVFDYTVIGDSVNLGARLEGANKFFSTQILISEYTREHLQSTFYTRMLDTLQVKGKAEPVGVYELFGSTTCPPDELTLSLAAAYEKGWALYAQGRWKEAAAHFTECLKIDRTDGPSARMVKLCETYQKKSPGKGWRPVTVLTEK
jgi:adenylate cyclase